MKKKLGLLIGAGALSAFLVVGSTLAWFTDEEQATNTLTMGKVDIEIYEQGALVGEEGLTFGDPDKGQIPLVPGAVIDKEVEVKNAGSVDSYIRVKLTPNVTGATEDKEIDLASMLDINTAVWTFNKDDGYYYYVGEGTTNGVVAANSFTSALFTTVTLPGKEWGNEMAEAVFTILIEAEAIQVDNFYPASGNTFSAAGLADAWSSN